MFIHEQYVMFIFARLIYFWRATLKMQVVKSSPLCMFGGSPSIKYLPDSHWRCSPECFGSPPTVWTLLAAILNNKSDTCRTGHFIVTGTHLSQRSRVQIAHFYWEMFHTAATILGHLSCSKSRGRTYVFCRNGVANLCSCTV